LDDHVIAEDGRQRQVCRRIFGEQRTAEKASNNQRKATTTAHRRDSFIKGHSTVQSELQAGRKMITQSGRTHRENVAQGVSVEANTDGAHTVEGSCD
jgi:hypothetical protein